MELFRRHEYQGVRRQTTCTGLFISGYRDMGTTLWGAGEPLIQLQYSDWICAVKGIPKTWPSKRWSMSWKFSRNSVLSIIPPSFCGKGLVNTMPGRSAFLIHPHVSERAPNGPYENKIFLGPRALFDRRRSGHESGGSETCLWTGNCHCWYTNNARFAKETMYT